MHGTLLSWTERIERLAPRIRLLAVVAGLAAVTAIDAVTGPDLAVAFLYSLVGMSAAWFLSRRAGIAAAVLAAVASFVVQVVERDGESWYVTIANGVLRAVLLYLLAILTSAVRRTFIDLVDTTRLDEMTGVLSRSGFLAALGDARRRAMQRKTPLGVVYLDLDGLKAVNDAHGHAAGDALIRRFVDGVERHLRSSDMFGRLGGDEFAIVLERVDALVIEGVVGRITSDPNIPQVSCGWRIFDGAYPSTAEMLARADRRMYEAKRRRSRRRQVT